MKIYYFTSCVTKYKVFSLDLIQRWWTLLRKHTKKNLLGCEKRKKNKIYSEQWWVLFLAHDAIEKSYSDFLWAYCSILQAISRQQYRITSWAHKEKSGKLDYRGKMNYFLPQKHFVLIAPKKYQSISSDGHEKEQNLCFMCGLMQQKYFIH